MKKLMGLLIVAATFVASTVVAAENYPADDAGKNYPADNSGKNVRDRSATAVTSGDQSNSKSDVKITQTIRKAVVADKSLSTNAHNVKIVTNGGVVTLRGPVKTAKEKQVIYAKAMRVQGVSRVDNELEVVSQ